jgi:hypothetical protein
VASLQDYQSHAREQKGLKFKSDPMLMTGKLESRADLLNFIWSHPLPATLEDMDDLKTYAVDGIADIWDTFKEPNGSMVRFFTRTHSYAFIRIHTHPYETSISTTSLKASWKDPHHLRRLTYPYAFIRIHMHHNAS